MDSYDQAIDALVAGNLSEAIAGFHKCVMGNERIAEAHFFQCVAYALAGMNAEANAALVSYRQENTASLKDDFYATFGKVIQAHGDSGEQLRAIFKRERILPRQWSMQMALDPALKQVEPWYYSAAQMKLFPRKVEDFEDLPGVVEKFVLPGHVPAEPLFDDQSALLTIGSCFAEELKNYLAEQSRPASWMFVPTALNNTFALKQFIEWCVTGNQSPSAYWYDESTSGGAIKWKPAVEQESYRTSIESVAGFVFTIGLAEVWEDINTGSIFWRGVPKSIYNKDHHRCRMSTVEENIGNLREIIRLLRTVHPDTPIILTLSPVPLKATFDAKSCVTNDCVSKSILRVAIDQVLNDRIHGVYYWPSFEIVRWLGGHLSTAMYGDDGNPRHVNRFAVKLILDSFIKHFYKGG